MKKTFPTRGIKRTVKKFLWFPKFINDEIRWLEFAVWIQVYHGPVRGWRSTEWS